MVALHSKFRTNETLKVHRVDRSTTQGPSWGYLKVNFSEMLSIFGDKRPRNGSKNGDMAPRTGTGYPHIGPFVAPQNPLLHKSTEVPLVLQDVPLSTFVAVGSALGMPKRGIDAGIRVPDHWVLLYHQILQSADARMWHVSDSQRQIMSLSFGEKSFKFQVVPSSLESGHHSPVSSTEKN